MPYYQCPKCGGGDTYQGTELVSGSKGGGAIIGPENELGFSPVVGVGGKTTVDEQTVVKCKTCDINLGQKDFHYSKEELEKIEAVEEAAEKKRRREIFISIIIVFLFLVALFCVFGFLATFEPMPAQVKWTWRAIYGLIFTGNIAGIIHLIRRIYYWYEYLPIKPETPLHNAVTNFEIDVVKQLLANGADVNANAEYGRPLHNAVILQDELLKYNEKDQFAKMKEMVELLLAKGAKVNAKDDSGETALYSLCNFPDDCAPAIAEILIANGADVNAKEFMETTPLSIAAQNGAIELIELLIAAGADVNTKDDGGDTPLDCAEDIDEDDSCTGHRAPTVNLLRKHGGKTGAELKAAGK